MCTTNVEIIQMKYLGYMGRSDGEQELSGMYKVAICDDDLSYIRELKKLILSCVNSDTEICFSEFTSADTLLEEFNGNEDAIFLDIQMDGMDGNVAAVKLKKKGFSGILVQCSGIYHPTPETIVIAPYRYIQKNDGEEINRKVIMEILREIVRRSSWEALLVECGEEQKMIKVSDIAYIVRHRRGAEIYTAYGENEKPRISKIPFDELRERLRDAGFGFPHNSYIVNMRYITIIEKKDNTFKLAGRTLTIARSKKDEFIREFVKYANMKYR